MNKNNKIRILHVVHGMDCGGAENFIMNVYRSIDRNKFQFDFLVHTDKKCFFDEEINSLGGKIYHAPYYYVLNYFSYRMFLNEFFKNHKEIQIVHGHLGSCSNIYLNIAKKYNKYTIVHCHSGRPYKQTAKGLLYLYSCKRTRSIADFFFSCNYDGALYRYGKKIIEDNNKFKIIPNAIDIKKYSPNTSVRKKIQTELKLNDDTLLFGHIGSFYKVKNHKFLIEIFEKIIKMKSSAKLILLGDGPLKPGIEKLVRDKQLEKYIIFTGVVKSIQDYLQIIDCILFPSFYEGLPLTLVEAQAANIPCLITDSIPKDVKLTNLIHYKSLNESSNSWAQSAIEIAENTISVDQKFDKLLDFDINNVTRILSEFYIQKRKKGKILCFR